jgi:hypothetical protein
LVREGRNDDYIWLDSSHWNNREAYQYLSVKLSGNKYSYPISTRRILRYGEYDNYGKMISGANIVHQKDNQGNYVTHEQLWDWWDRTTKGIYFPKIVFYENWWSGSYYYIIGKPKFIMSIPNTLSLSTYQK